MKGWCRNHYDSARTPLGFQAEGWVGATESLRRTFRGGGVEFPRVNDKGNMRKRRRLWGVNGTMNFSK